MEINFAHFEFNSCGYKSTLFVKTNKDLSDLSYSLVLHQLDYPVFRFGDWIAIGVPNFSTSLINELISHCKNF